MNLQGCTLDGGDEEGSFSDGMPLCNERGDVFSSFTERIFERGTNGTGGTAQA